MNEITTISKQNLDKAFQIIEELKIKEIWQDLDSTCNLVSSVKKNGRFTTIIWTFHETFVVGLELTLHHTK